LARTFRWMPMFATAHAQIATLLEMVADDAASSLADRRALAGAIVALGTGVRPEAALSASDTAAVIRVRRLTSTTRAPMWGTGLAAVAGAALLLSVPLGLAVAPAVEAAARDCCTVADLSTDD